MNTVVSDPRTSQFRDPLIKHVIMEKEIYRCIENPGTPEERPFERDVETFIEIIQRAQGGRTTTVEKRVEEIICDFSFFGVALSRCSTRDIPLQEGPLPFSCFLPPPDAPPQLRDPVEMDTVITSRQDTVKTMKVDRWFIQCEVPSGDLIAHYYLFTEIVEGRIGGAADSIRPTEKKFQAILCASRTSTGTGQIESCHHIIPTVPPAA